MGFYGEVICYTATECLDPVGLVGQVMDKLQIENIRRAERSNEPDNSWQVWELLSAGLIEEEHEFDDIDGPVERNDLGDLFPLGGRLFLFFSDPSPLALKVCEACGRIPEDIANRFSPSASPALCVGWHDIIDGEYDEPFLVDRAFFSVTLSNPGAPNKWEETRDRILALPELRDFCAAIEKVAGPMKSWVRWT